jgi:hypothetical protein
MNKWDMPEEYKGNSTPLTDNFLSPPIDFEKYILPIHTNEEFKNLKPLECLGFKYKGEMNEEEEEEVQTITIEFHVKKALYHEGKSTKTTCLVCQEKFKRYVRMKLVNGKNAFICVNCFENVNGNDDGYDRSYNSD